MQAQEAWMSLVPTIELSAWCGATVKQLGRSNLGWAPSPGGDERMNRSPTAKWRSGFQAGRPQGPVYSDSPMPAWLLKCYVSVTIIVVIVAW